MSKPVFAFLISLLTTVAFCQDTKWFKYSGGTEVSHTLPKRIVAHPNGSTYIVGQYNGQPEFDGYTIASPEGTIDDAFIARYDSDGNLVWVKQLIIPAHDFTVNRVTDIKLDRNNDLIVCGFQFYPGSFLGVSEISRGPFIAKIDEDANPIWVQYEPHTSYFDADPGRRGNRIAIDQNNHIFWITDQNSETSWNVFDGGLAVIKYTTNGTKVWERFITDNVSYYHPTISSFTMDNDGNFLVSGTFFEHMVVGNKHLYDNSNNNLNRMQGYVAKYDSDAKFQWGLQTNSGASSPSLTSYMDQQGDVYLSTVIGTEGHFGEGNSKIINNSYSSTYLIKLTPSGTIAWHNRVPATYAYDITASRDGNFLVTCTAWGDINYQSYSKSMDNPSPYILKIDEFGNFRGIIEGSTFDDPSTMYGISIHGFQTVQDKNGAILTMGYFMDQLTFGCLSQMSSIGSLYLVKLDDGNRTPHKVTGPPELCNGGVVELTTTQVENATEYYWYLPTGITPVTGGTVTSENRIMVNVSPEANHKAVTVWLDEDCFNSYGEGYVFKVLEKPGIPNFMTSESQVCPGSEVLFELEQSESTTNLEWRLPIKVMTQADPTNSALLNFAPEFVEGTIEVIASNHCGETATSLYVNTFPVPGKPELSGEIVLCSDDENFNKTASPAPHAKHYEWNLSTGVIHHPLYSTTEPTLHATISPDVENGSVKVRAMGECGPGEYSNIINITRYAKPGNALPISGPAQVCLSDEATVTFTVPEIPNALQYLWQPSEGFTETASLESTSNTITLKIREATNLSVSVFAVNRCDEAGQSSSIQLESFLRLPTPSLSKTTCDREVHVANAERPVWFKDNVEIQEFHETNLVVTDSATYYVSVENFCGVVQSEIIQLHPVTPNTLTIPNIITPNGDGKNDFLILDKAINGSSIQIFNRWGEILFSDENYQNTWSGQGVSSGTYYFYLINSCLPKPLKGWIVVAE